MRVWFWRILLFPLWIFFLHRRRRIAAEANEPVIIVRPKTHWEMAICSDGEEYARQSVTYTDEEDGFIFTTMFDIKDAITITESRLYWRGRLMGRSNLNLEVCQFDFINIRFALDPIRVQKEERKWLGTPISELDDKHLYNIVKGIERGHWKSGAKVNIEPRLAGALIGEYRARDLSREDEVEFERRNAQYERAKRAGYFNLATCS